jgi:hypothetical protein
MTDLRALRRNERRVMNEDVALRNHVKHFLWRGPFIRLNLVVEEGRTGNVQVDRRSRILPARKSVNGSLKLSVASLKEGRQQEEPHPPEETGGAD